MYIYKYVYVYIYISMYMYIYVYVYIYKYICMYICIYICTYMYVCISISLSLSFYMYAYIYIYKHFLNMYIYIYIYIYIYTYVYIYIERLRGWTAQVGRRLGLGTEATGRRLLHVGTPLTVPFRVFAGVCLWIWVPASVQNVSASTSPAVFPRWLWRVVACRHALDCWLPRQPPSRPGLL